MSNTLEYLRGLSDGSKEAFMLRQLDLAAEFRKSLQRHGPLGRGYGQCGDSLTATARRGHAY